MDEEAIKEDRRAEDDSKHVQFIKTHKSIVLIRERRRDEDADILTPQLILLPVTKQIVPTDRERQPG